MNELEFARVMQMLERACQLLDEAYAVHCKAVEAKAA